jgi:folate-binding protein YgfZ
VLLSTPQGYLICLPADIADGLAQRIRKFVMRAQVTIAHEGELGILGHRRAASRRVDHAGIRGAATRPPWAVMRHSTTCVIRLPRDNFLVGGPFGQDAGSMGKLINHAVPAGAECWNWAQIQSGLPWITAATQDQFLPQMIGLDAIGGVSFDKGCYTGQEIVARGRYLGEIKRKCASAARLGSSAQETSCFRGNSSVGPW